MLAIDRVMYSQTGLRLTESEILSEISNLSSDEFSKENRIHLEKGDRYWSCTIYGPVITYRWGKIDGQEIEQVSVVEDGKNLGRSNETTPDQQALIEAIPKINKRIMEGYVVVEESGSLSGLNLKEKPDVPHPMLARPLGDLAKTIPPDEPAYFQPKLDGIRCIANLRTGELYSRKLEPIVIPEISREVIKIGLSIKNADWLDGELYNHDLGFQKITSIVRTRNKTHEEIGKISYHVYDTICDLEQEKRIDLLCKIPRDLQRIRVVDSFFGTVSESSSYHSKFTKMGYEGAMMRLCGIPYESGKRSSNLLKIKTFHQEEFEVKGLEREEFEDTLGKFILSTKAGKIFKARPAFSDEERKTIWNEREEYDWNKYVATVKFFEYTKDGSVRFPVVLGIRYEADT